MTRPSKISLLAVRSSQAKECLDVTDAVERALAALDAREGLCCLFVQHTTACLAVGEASEGTAEDLLEVAQRMIPQLRFRHAHDPSHAPDHMASSIIGPSLVVPVIDGRLALGTWQRVLLLELNGPRERSVVVSVAGS